MHMKKAKKLNCYLRLQVLVLNTDQNRRKLMVVCSNWNTDAISILMTNFISSRSIKFFTVVVGYEWKVTSLIQTNIAIPKLKYILAYS